MPEIKTVAKVSTRGSLNRADLKAQLILLGIQVVAGALSALSTYLTVTLTPYLQAHPGTATAVALAMLPTLQALIAQGLKLLQQLTDGPPSEVVESVDLNMPLPEGYERTMGVEKVE